MVNNKTSSFIKINEKDRQIDAYEYYFSLGSDRSYPKVAEKFDCTVQTVYNWSRSFKWAARIKERNIKIARRVREKLDTEIVNSKADYRKDIQDNLLIIKSAILTALHPKSKRINIKAKSSNDLNQLITSLEKLIKLDLILMGDDAFAKPIVLNMNFGDKKDQNGN